MAIRGDFPALRSAIVRVAKLGEMGPRVAHEASVEIAALIGAQFANGVNPYGTPWKALAPATVAKGRAAPPLTDTGRTKGSIVVAGEGSRIVVKIGDMKAGFHQWGARRGRWKLPKRQIVPDGRVPDQWRQRIRSVARDVARDILAGR